MSARGFISQPVIVSVWLCSLTVATVVVLLSGCSTAAYYAQSIGGHISLIMRSQPIDELVLEPDTPAPLKRKLHAVVKIRDFASRELALPDNDSYRSYADLERRYVVWSIFATPEFSLEPKQWCFPVAGCVNYRGYFSKRGADAFADKLRQRGYDVYVAGVGAYSTLGWFADPVPSTILERPLYHTARIIFHELAHQRLYIPNDTPFNEAFAVAVEREGMRRWLRLDDSGKMTAAYSLSIEREKEFLALVRRIRERLARLYGEDLSIDEKRWRKALIFGKMRADYMKLRDKWGGGGGYESWFAKELNNAKLASVTTYHELVPSFERLLARHNGKLTDFYRGCESIGRLSPEQRQRALTDVDDVATTASTSRPP